MNAQHDPQQSNLQTSADLGQRVARLEGITERVLDEMRTLRQEMRAEFSDARKQMTTDFRTLLGAIVAVAIGLASLILRHG
ncbi:MAG: hypothetical protein ACXU8N_21330 [Telluria sp.]